MRTALRVLLCLAFAGSLFIGPHAQASCHRFTVASVSQVSEGNKIEVTIERDAAVNPSSVRVATVDGTAKAPADYTKFDQRVSFTSETEKKIQIQTKEDAGPESQETFSVKVSEGQGCQVKPNFQYGDPKRITIQDDDAARPAVKTGAPAKTTAPRAVPQTTTVATTTAPTSTPTPKATRSAAKVRAPRPTPTVTALAVATEEDDGASPWLVVGAIGGLLAAAGGALIVTRLRGGA